MGILVLLAMWVWIVQATEESGFGTIGNSASDNRGNSDLGGSFDFGNVDASSFSTVGTSSCGIVGNFGLGSLWFWWKL